MDEPIDERPNVLHKGQVIEIRQSVQFAEWIGGLRDRRARVRISDRLKRLAAGHVGDGKPVGGGVQELRFVFGSGYRVYYIWLNGALVILLIGGDKGSQTRDIAKAKALAKEAKDGIENITL